MCCAYYLGSTIALFRMCFRDGFLFFLFFLVLFILNYYGPLILEVSKSIYMNVVISKGPVRNKDLRNKFF